MPPSSSGERILGCQEPSARVCPEYARTDVDDARDVLGKGGFVLDPWQLSTLRDWMARTEQGTWACPTCGLSVPRQNGKTALVAARIESGMLLFNEQVIYTAHLQKTATETFEEIVNFFDTPKMRKHVRAIKTALGREQVILKSGARVKFLARTRNGGRGQHGDLWLVDEAQCLDDEGQASFLPAISASRNPQAIYVGTPPDSSEFGDVFKNIRADALAGNTSRTSWTEFSVPEIGDVHDVSRWVATNPALGRRIQLATIEGEVEQMAEDAFARERLGWWSPVNTAKHLVSQKDWEACKVEYAPQGDPTAYAAKFSADGSVGTIAVCVDSDAPFVEVCANRSMRHGVRWFARWLADRADRVDAIVIDGKSNAQTLVDKLLEEGVDEDLIVRPSTADVIAANAAFVDATREHGLSHAGQPALADSATLSDYRKIGGDGGFGFQSNDKADATLAEACALAYWCALSIRRDPRQELRIG